MKKLLNKILTLGYESDIASTNSEEKNQNKINNVATKILVEFILCDGVMDPKELKELNKILLSMNIKININDLVEETKNQSSFYEQVSEINNLYSTNMKIDLMTKIWSIVNADNIIDKYELNLFYRIGELLFLKRSKLNEIRNT
ncbi:MAG: TerB family tellurite resistance protein [Gammaproteobacteria bacterium]